MSDKVVYFEHVKNLENKDEALIIDVREPHELSSTGKIGGSINIPLGELEDSLRILTEEEFKRKYGRSKPHAEFPLVFSCKMGGRAAKAMDIANNLGYKNAKYYKGSWTEWEQRNK